MSLFLSFSGVEFFQCSNTFVPRSQIDTQSRRLTIIGDRHKEHAHRLNLNLNLLIPPSYFLIPSHPRTNPASQIRYLMKIVRDDRHRSHDRRRFYDP